MAIKRSQNNPVLVLDAVIAGVERDAFTKQDGTGEVIDRGRRLAVQTGAPNSDLLEVRVRVEQDSVPFEVGQHVLLNVEYSEYSFTDERGRERVGSIMRYHSHVSPSQFDAWAGVVKSQRQAQPA